MKILILLGLLILGSCATKYIVPGNRFLTPETQGGAFHGQFELQQTQANQLTIDTSNSSVDDGVIYSEVSRTGFLYSNSFFEPFDLFWSHVGSGNSLIGGKFQFLGTSRTTKGDGHKMAAAVAFGGNEHETDDESVEFKLTGQEFSLLYGYRFSENVMPYLNASLASYNFQGKISSTNPGLNGAKPEFDTTIRSLSGGVEVSYEYIFAKAECTYQQLATTDTKDLTNWIFGYSVGLNW